MVQAVEDYIPRVRRAIEGPVPLADGAAGRLTDTQVEALTADALADIILLTKGQWPHKLLRDAPVPDESWSVDPAISEPEERMIALQVALNYFYFVFQNAKTGEVIQNEGQSYEWSKSAQAMVRQIDAVKEARDRALEAVLAEFPVLAKYASFIATRDVTAAPLLEPWRTSAGDSGVPGGVLYEYLL